MARGRIDAIKEGYKNADGIQINTRVIKLLDKIEKLITVV